MSAKKGFSLDRIENFPRKFIEKLAELWVTTAEDLIGMASTDEGLNGLSMHIGVKREEVIKLVALAKEHLPDALVRELEEPVDEAEYGLGALEPEDEDEQ